MLFALQPIECKAAVAWEAEKPLDWTTVIVAPPQKGEVRIKVSFYCENYKCKSCFLHCGQIHCGQRGEVAYTEAPAIFSACLIGLVFCNIGGTQNSIKYLAHTLPSFHLDKAARV